jgi:hypothetical protein
VLSLDGGGDFATLIRGESISLAVIDLLPRQWPVPPSCSGVAYESRRGGETAFGGQFPMPIINLMRQKIEARILTGEARRPSLSVVSAHFFRAMRSGGNGQPIDRARVRTLVILRLSAAATLTTDAP